MKTDRILTMAQAISEGIAQEMTRDSNVFVMGEDVGSYGGIFGATGGLLDKFGKDRIMTRPFLRLPSLAPQQERRRLDCVLLWS